MSETIGPLGQRRRRSDDDRTNGDYDHRTHPLDVLVPGIAAQNTVAYGELYALLADRLFAFAFRLLGDPHEAEDAVQQAFLELARTDTPPTRGRSLEAWMFTSVRFTCADVVRQRTRRPAVPSDDVPDLDYEDLYDLGLDPVLESALRSLTPQQRAVLHLKHVEGVDGEQIAGILGLTRMAVYATAARAERRLRELLGASSGRHPLSRFRGLGHG